MATTPVGGGSPKPVARAPVKKVVAKRAASSTGRASSAESSSSGITMDSFLSSLRQHESVNNYTSSSNSSSASGAYGYLDSTWGGYKGYARAKDAPPSVQDARARADCAASLRHYGGDWRKVAAAHFAGGGWVSRHPDPSTWNQNPVPGSNNPTVTAYVRGIIGGAGGKLGATNASVSSAQASGQASVPASSSQVLSAFEQQYGYAASYLNSIPELRGILARAAAGGYDEGQLKAAVAATGWWKQTQASARTFDEQRATDPSTTQARVDAKYADLAAQSQKVGYVADPTHLRQIALQSVRMGWTAQQDTNAIQSELKFNTKGPGNYNTALASITAISKRYGVKSSPATLANFARQIARGDISVGDYQTQIITISKRQHPELSAFYDQGGDYTQYGVRLRGLVTELSDKAKQAGLGYTPQQITQMAGNAVAKGLTAQQINDTLFKGGTLNYGQQGATGAGASVGKAGGPATTNQAVTTRAQLTEQASNYYVPISNTAMDQWVRQVESGQITTADFDGYLKEQAKSLFPSLATAIDRGVSVKQYADPYVSSAANILEKTPDQIDVQHNPTYMKALFNMDPKTGQNAPMGLADWQTYLKKLPDYAKTKQANQQAAGLSNTIEQMFGKVG